VRSGAPALHQSGVRRLVPDPEVIRTRGVYYAFGTTGGRLQGPTGRAFTGRPLARTSSPGRRSAGPSRPPVTGRGVQYWRPRSPSTRGASTCTTPWARRAEESMALRVATSDRPEGPYTDTGTPPRRVHREPLSPRRAPVPRRRRAVVPVLRPQLPRGRRRLQGRHRARRRPARRDDAPRRRVPHRAAPALRLDALRGQPHDGRLRPHLRRVAHHRGGVHPAAPGQVLLLLQRRQLADAALRRRLRGGRPGDRAVHGAGARGPRAPRRGRPRARPRPPLGGRGARRARLLRLPRLERRPHGAPALHRPARVDGRGPRVTPTVTARRVGA
jgi:hypothetical protein